MPGNADATPTLRQRIEAFPRWHYDFNLAGIHTPIFDPAHRTRHAERIRYFFDPLLELFGGTLEGKRVLDLGCNAGFWSLQCAKRGAAYVLGLDGRQMHIDQANLVFEASCIPSDYYEFRTANVFDVRDLGESFDVVLNLGLMYHVSKHMQLVEIIAQHASDVIVTDTAIAPGFGSFIRHRHEPTSEPRNAVDYELVGLPSRAAVIDLFAVVGFKTVTLTPRFTSWEGSEDFRHGSRRAFISSRSRELSDLDAEPLTLHGEAVNWLRRSRVVGRLLR
jgi:SAM-dependent methyltransferase